MPNVFQIKHAAERRAALLTKETEVDSKPDEPDGVLQFTHSDCGSSQMVITGAYADRLQVAVYTLAKGLNYLVDRLAENGAVGSFSMGPINDALPRPPRVARSSMPRRMTEETDFGGLK